MSSSAYDTARAYSSALVVARIRRDTGRRIAARARRRAIRALAAAACRRLAAAGAWAVAGLRSGR